MVIEIVNDDVLDCDIDAIVEDVHRAQEKGRMREIPNPFYAGLSLSDELVESLHVFAREHDCSPESVIEDALRAFLKVS